MQMAACMCLFRLLSEECVGKNCSPLLDRWGGDKSAQWPSVNMHENPFTLWELRSSLETFPYYDKEKSNFPHPSPQSQLILENRYPSWKKKWGRSDRTCVHTCYEVSYRNIEVVCQYTDLDATPENLGQQIQNNTIKIPETTWRVCSAWFQKFSYSSISMRLDFHSSNSIVVSEHRCGISVQQFT